MPSIKRNGKVRICIDFRNLNLATPKDEYVMPVADMLIDSAAGRKILSLMDGYAGYNQIMLVEEDILPARKDGQFGKWSPNWEGPYIIKQAYSGGHASSLQETEKREALLLMGDT